MHNLFQCTGIVSYIVSGFLSCFIQSFIVVQEVVHNLLEILHSLYFKATLALKQALSFTEPLVVRTENNRHTIYGSFQHIVDTYPESTSDLGNFSIAINGRQQTETVNQQAIGFFHLFFRSLRITHYGTVQFTGNFLQMAFINHVRCND